MRGIGVITAVFLLLFPIMPDTGTIIYDTEAPVEVQDICNKYGEMYDICPELLQAICYHESRYTYDAVNSSCKGIMQINAPVHKERMAKLGVTDIFDVDSNIHVGADYLAELFADYPDAATVLGLYHGEKNAVAKGKSGNYSKYTKEILEKAYELERLHGK